MCFISAEEMVFERESVIKLGKITCTSYQSVGFKGDLQNPALKLLDNIPIYFSTVNWPIISFQTLISRHTFF